MFDILSLGKCSICGAEEIDVYLIVNEYVCHECLSSGILSSVKTERERHRKKLISGVR